MRITPAPGYLILEPHSLEKKIGSFQMPKTEDDEEAPQLGKVIQVGELVSKMPFDPQHLPKVGDVIAYKKFNVFKQTLGIKKYIASHFENYLFTVKEDE